MPPPDDSYHDYFNLEAAVWYNKRVGDYFVDGPFFQAFLANPAWILEDGAYVAPNANGSFELYNVLPGSIAAALGLQSGDIPDTLNRMDITSLDGFVNAWLRLQHENQFELVVQRGSALVTLDYWVVYR